jgi:DNA-binding MarR family transcriptional regulator
MNCRQRYDPLVNRDEAAREITECVTVLFFSAENQSRFHGASEELGLSPPMLKGLLELEPGERIPMRELAERWGCDASFVTVMCDGLEARGLVRRRVAAHDRRIKVVELTDAGEAALDRVTRVVYGPRAGFDALSAAEQAMLAHLLRRVADAQAAHDEEIIDQPDVKAMSRRLTAQRTRAARGRGRSRGGRAGRAEGDVAPWKAHLDAYRRELADLKDELARVRDEVKAQARRPVDGAKAAKAGVKAEVKEAKASAKADVTAARDDAIRQLKGGRRRR